MLPLDHPDRIQITFDDRRLLANAGLLLPVTLAQHLGLRELVDHHLDLGNAPGRGRCVAHRGDRPGARFHGQGAIHHRQLQLGLRAPTGSGEP